MFRQLVYRVLAALILLTTVAHADSIVTGSKPFTFIPGTVISSSAVNADFDYIINQVNTNAAKNGVNSSITALVGLTTPLSPSQGGSPIYTAGTAGGTVDVLTISSTVPAVSSYSLSNSNLVSFIAAGSNTVSGPTLNVNATGAKTLQKVSSGGKVDLKPGELVSANAYLVYYDGVSYVVINMPRLYGTATTLASAGTTDLGLIGSHNITLTGVTTITAFGSTANINEPLYYVKYTGAGLTLTFNATSLITPSGNNIFLNTNDTILVEYLGSGNWRIQDFTPAAGGGNGGIGAANGIIIQNNAGTPNSQIDLTVASATLVTTAGNASSFNIGSTFTINAATTGVNGLDTGSLANTTWYYIYIISNGSSSGGLLSTSATAPTMPTGYGYKHRVGAMVTNGSAQFFRFVQRGRNAQYRVVGGSNTVNLPIISSGIQGSSSTPTWTTPSIVNFFPPTATMWRGVLRRTSTGGIGPIVAPNSGYGAPTTASNPPIMTIADQTAGEWAFVPEGTTVAYASNVADGAIHALGWDDSVNAN